MTHPTIGIDISKDTLDAFCTKRQIHKQFANTKRGHTTLIRWIEATDVRIVYEPTGPYHRALEAALASAGFALCKVNPRQARRFAEAVGSPAKTDKLDAAMLARMGQALKLKARPVADKTLADLRELITARRALIKDRVATKNQAQTLTIPLLKRQSNQRLAQIDRQIARLDQRIETLINSDPVRAQQAEILLSIPGVAQATAYAILIDLPEIGTLQAKKLTALAGLAPRTRQSGKWTGKAFVWGGRKTVRNALYMPALVACRFNPDLKAKYQAMIKAGKPPKVAITAVMRKIIVLANALIKNNKMWTKNPA